MKNLRHKSHPETPKQLIQCIKNEKNIDQRTKAARSIKQTRKAVAADLDATAKVLLEKDVAHCATIQAMLVKEISENFKGKDGALHPGLQTLLRFQASSRASLLALKKFKDGQKKPQAKGIADLFEAAEDEEY